MIRRKKCIQEKTIFPSVFYLKQKEKDSIKILQLLMRKRNYDWASWLIVRLMTYKQYVSYAVFAAEQVIDIFEKKYPECLLSDPTLYLLR